MTQIDISTAAILARAEHIEHCAMGTHNQDALRMRALVAERNTLANQVEDCARTCAEQAEEILNLKNACKAVLPLMQALDREEVTDVADWHSAEALIHAAMEAAQ